MTELPPPDHAETPPPYAAPLSPPPAKSFHPTAWLAWAVIIGVCVLLPVLRTLKADAPAATPGGVPAVDVAPGTQVELAAKMAVGAAHMLGANNKTLDTLIGLPQGTPGEKISAAIVSAELGARDAAIKSLSGMKDDRDAAELRRFYGQKTPLTTTTTSTAKPTVSATSTATQPATLSADFHDRFGWFARLAESYGRPDTDPQRATVLSEAKRTTTVFGIGFSFLGLVVIVGFGLFVTAVILLSIGRIHFAVGRPAGPAHVYVETIAIYLSGFIVVSLLIGLLLPHATLAQEVLGLLVVVIVSALWPRLRGVPWAIQRQDWGVHLGRGLLREMFAGVCGYLAGVPVMIAGFLIMLGILSLTRTTPSHPIMDQPDSSMKAALMLYLIASVFAPLTEELMFRGALVSHLRSGVGVVLAALISGVVFGAVHPQGWAVVPALASVGGVFACIRQWRGSLVPSITAHALHNGFLITMLTLAR